MSLLGHDSFVICSFCNRESRQIKYMVKGPKDANICNECVEICLELIKERLEEQKKEQNK